MVSYYSWLSPFLKSFQVPTTNRVISLCYKTDRSPPLIYLACRVKFTLPFGRSSLWSNLCQLLYLLACPSPLCTPAMPLLTVSWTHHDVSRFHNLPCAWNVLVHWLFYSPISIYLSDLTMEAVLLWHMSLCISSTQQNTCYRVGV